jgi:CHC2 zinc finger
LDGSPAALCATHPGRFPADIDAAVYVEQLARLPVPTHRKVECPFHDDRTPSLHLYRDPARGWYCYGCGRGGSIYDFAALLWHRETRGADFMRLRNDLLEALG